MNSVIVVVIQEVPNWGRINWSDVFCLFRSQFGEIRHVHSFLEGVRVALKTAILDPMFVVLSRRC